MGAVHSAAAVFLVCIDVHVGALQVVISQADGKATYKLCEPNLSIPDVSVEGVVDDASALRYRAPEAATSRSMCEDVCSLRVYAPYVTKGFVDVDCRICSMFFSYGRNNDPVTTLLAACISRECYL